MTGTYEAVSTYAILSVMIGVYIYLKLTSLAKLTSEFEPIKRIEEE